MNNSSQYPKPTIKMVELASSEIPIIRNRLAQIGKERDELDREEEQLKNDLDAYEAVLASTAKSFSDLQALHLGISSVVKTFTPIELEYKSLPSYSEKILFVAKHSDQFDLSLLVTGKDIINKMVELEKKINDVVSDALQTTIQSTISRFYDKKLLLKYRYKGTKGKYVTVHKDWLDHGIFRPEYKGLEEYIEPVPAGDENSEAPLLSEAS